MVKSDSSARGQVRGAAAQKVQAIARGNSARRLLRETQLKEVYGGTEKPLSEVEKLRQRIAHLEKENRMLKLRLEPLPQNAADTAGSAAKTAASGPRAAKGSGSALWSLESWLHTVPMPKIVSNSLLKHLKGQGAVPSTSGLEQAFMDELGTSGDLETFMALLKDALVLEEIADALFASAKKLAKQKAAARTRALRAANSKAAESAGGEDAQLAAFRAKFVDEGARELIMGSYKTFFGQLHGLIGLPVGGDVARVLEAMEVEHCKRPDAATEFEPGNYGTRTTSAKEYAFVANGAQGPAEQRNIEENRRRKARTVSSYAAERKACDAKLEALGIAEVSDAEFIAARLYTGPLYVKYNTILRCKGAAGSSVFLTKLMQELCAGNQYETTLHLLSSAIHKLGHIQKAAPLYRAPGGVLPEAFWRFDEYNSRGGVEFAFMSATADREVALEYAQQSQAGVIFQIHQAMVDRGADLSWLSQYPFEAEVTFPCLTALETRDSHVEGSTIVVEMTPRLVDELDQVSAPEQKKSGGSSICTVM